MDRHITFRFHYVLHFPCSQTDRASFVTALVELLGIRNTWSKAKDVSLTRGHQRSLEVSAGSPVHVYMNDLESAVHYSLKQEVARYQVISGERLDALKCYVIVLAKVSDLIFVHLTV